MLTDLQLTPVHRQTDSKRKTSIKIETFELSKKEHPYIPVSTTKILGKFTRDPPPDLHDVALQERRSVLRKHAETVEELRKWAKTRENSTAVKLLQRIVFWKAVKLRMPPEQKLYRSINHFFPPRSQMKVLICDFGADKAERNEVRLGDIERGKDKMCFGENTVTRDRISAKAFLGYSPMDVRGNLMLSDLILTIFSIDMLHWA